MRNSMKSSLKFLKDKSSINVNRYATLENLIFFLKKKGENMHKTSKLGFALKKNIFFLLKGLPGVFYVLNSPGAFICLIVGH